MSVTSQKQKLKAMPLLDQCNSGVEPLERVSLLKAYIRQCLRAGEAGAVDSKLVIFIADGDVMSLADIAIGNKVTVAKRNVEQISTAIRKRVDETLARIFSECSEDKSRIA